MSFLARLQAGRNWYTATSPVIEYCGVVERNRAGEPHVHVVAVLHWAPTTVQQIALKGWWLARFGICDVTPVQGVSRLAQYLAKASGPTEHFFVSKDLRLPRQR